MARAILIACSPWLAALLVLILAAWALVRFSRAQLRLGRLLNLHRDETGSVQSLSFVLALPVFIFIMLMIVQISQLMIGIVVVHYAAFATARSAAVWIPAYTVSLSPAIVEGPCCISSYSVDSNPADQAGPAANSPAAGSGPSSGGTTYLIAPGSPKYMKIASAAVLALVPISPSRDVGAGTPSTDAWPLIDPVLKNAYGALAPSSSANGRIGPRIDNKLAYAIQNTQVEIRFYHKNEEPPLTTYGLPYDANEFYPNEVGWQDLITVKVKYQFPLLPGAGRLLAKYIAPRTGSADTVAENIEKQGGVYTYPLQAEATIGNEGEKSMLPQGYEFIKSGGQ